MHNIIWSILELSRVMIGRWSAIQKIQGSGSHGHVFSILLLSTPDLGLTSSDEDTDMIEELLTSSELLKAALERYLDACSVIANYFEAENTFSTISQVVTNELQSMYSYETTMKRAKAKFRRVRNSFPTIVPINTLPPETLTHIFQLVVHSEHCHYDPQKFKFILKRPEILSHVCARWRGIAIESSGLWNHIDLDPQLLARGDMFVARAGPLTLDIHIVTKCLQDPGDNLSAFCASIAPRVNSLDVSGLDGGAHLSILKACFSNCVPGTLSHLNLNGHIHESHSFPYSFIEAENPSDDIDNSQALQIPHQQFEDVLSRINALHLRGTYFCWNSRAYHGLVELTILPQLWGYRQALITGSELTAVLAASPMLREFTFGLVIIDLEEDGPPPPVALNELEFMHLCFKEHSQREALLRMISPGPKPLGLLLEFRSILPPKDGDEVLDMFLARANVTDLSIKCRERARGTIPNLPKLLKSSPSIRSLTLDRYYGFLGNSDYASDTNGDEGLPTGLHLDSLNLLDSKVDLRLLRWIVKRIPIQTLGLDDDCRIRDTFADLKPDDPECMSKLYEIFPVVEEIVREGLSELND